MAENFQDEKQSVGSRSSANSKQENTKGTTHRCIGLTLESQRKRGNLENWKKKMIHYTQGTNNTLNG